MSGWVGERVRMSGWVGISIIVEIFLFVNFIVIIKSRIIKKRNMNRLFGSGKPKAPPPNLTDCITNVSLFLSNFYFNFIFTILLC